MLDFLRTDTFLIILGIGVILLFILYISNLIKLSKLRKNYKSFMKKIGNGKDIQEALNQYVERVDKVEKASNELKTYCDSLNKKADNCLQKIGMVRYSAFKDTGSDLSFALAILNENNDGIILNGIYSREMSNIYSKSVENGKSPYTLSEEEKEALNIALKK
jgi:biopolymer transport protein ExbB/TolQ